MAIEYLGCDNDTEGDVYMAIEYLESNDRADVANMYT